MSRTWLTQPNSESRARGYVSLYAVNAPSEKTDAVRIMLLFLAFKRVDVRCSLEERGSHFSLLILGHLMTTRTERHMMVTSHLF
jgi:hypothetical protein